jgi:hypothetical protein
VVEMHLVSRSRDAELLDIQQAMSRASSKKLQGRELDAMVAFL